MYEDDKKKLIGKTVTAYHLEPDGSRLTLHFEGDVEAVLNPYGDCCSSTWIESMDAPEALLGTIQAVEDLDMPNLGNVGTEKHGDVDQVSYYGMKITTNNGRCVIDYRNDSNGYYGGDLELSIPLTLVPICDIV